MSELLNKIKEDQIAEMKSATKDKLKIQTLRLIASSVKQIEIDEKIFANDALVTRVIIKMVKQRNDAIVMYDKANREDLSLIEQNEIATLDTYLPKMMPQNEIDAILDDLNPKSMADMGKVMSFFRNPEYTGKVDMGKLSITVKGRFN